MAAKRLNLECLKPKCFNCKVAANCEICEKGHKYDSCKIPYEHSSIWLKLQKCDTCVDQVTIYQCVIKKYCITFSLKKENI